MNKIAVRASQITASLGNTEILHDVTLALPQGRWTAIVGPNGAGKSTLLKVLAGLLPHQGEVELLGQPLHSYPARARAKALAWLGQSEVAADDLTVWDVVMLGRLPHQADWLGMVRCLLEAGVTVVSVLHEISMALNADELLIMAAGRVTHFGPSADTATHRALEAVFDHRITIHPLAGQWVALPKFSKQLGSDSN